MTSLRGQPPVPQTGWDQGPAWALGASSPAGRLGESGLPCPNSGSCTRLGSQTKLLENFGLDKPRPRLPLNLAFPVLWKHFNK